MIVYALNKFKSYYDKIYSVINNKIKVGKDT